MESSKDIHHMFHISLVFIIFPIVGVISGEYPLFDFALTALFIGAYYTILRKSLLPGSVLVSCLLTFYTSIWSDLCGMLLFIKSSNLSL